MNIVLFTLGILFGASGATLMKMGAQSVESADIITNFDKLAYFTKLLTNPSVFGGLILYFFSALLWLLLLTKLDVSYVQPILALTYVVTPIFAIVFLGESVSLMRWVGIGIIISGVVLVALSQTK